MCKQQHCLQHLPNPSESGSRENVSLHFQQRTSHPPLRTPRDKKHDIWGHSLTYFILYIFTSICYRVTYTLVAQTVKNLSTMQETWVRSLGQEDPLKKGMATDSVFLPGESHGQRSLVGYSPWDRRVRHD